MRKIGRTLHKRHIRTTLFPERHIRTTLLQEQQQESVAPDDDE